MMKIRMGRGLPGEHHSFRDGVFNMNNNLSMQQAKGVRLD